MAHLSRCFVAGVGIDGMPTAPPIGARAQAADRGRTSLPSTSAKRAGNPSRAARCACPSPPVPRPADAAAPFAGTPPAGGARGDVTGYLQAAQGGDPAAHDALYARVYGDLRRLARRVRAGRAGETLCTAALVHEAYAKIRPAAGHVWEDRHHFFGIAARAMRDVIVEAARRRRAAKRGGGGVFVTLGAADAAQPARADEVVALDEALTRLAALDPRRARVVEFRFFAGLTAAESAEVLGVSVPTVERDWRAARAWLAQALRDHGSDGGDLTP
ncbi:hypothetical protein tb265_02140 [Gemmatimonadetes bacterium T265]|nr:hypothetical protein tb265_02140 [Gemmatimonadetes bacterium T265]